MEACISYRAPFGALCCVPAKVPCTRPCLLLVCHRRRTAPLRGDSGGSTAGITPTLAYPECLTGSAGPFLDPTFDWSVCGQAPPCMCITVVHTEQRKARQSLCCFFPPLRRAGGVLHPAHYRSAKGIRIDCVVVFHVHCTQIRPLSSPSRRSLVRRKVGRSCVRVPAVVWVSVCSPHQLGRCTVVSKLHIFDAVCFIFSFRNDLEASFVKHACRGRKHSPTPHLVEM